MRGVLALEVESALVSPPSSSSSLRPPGSGSNPGFRNPRNSSGGFVPKELGLGAAVPAAPPPSRFAGGIGSGALGRVPRSPGGAGRLEFESWWQTRAAAGLRGDTSDTSEK